MATNKKSQKFQKSTSYPMDEDDLDAVFNEAWPTGIPGAHTKRSGAGTLLFALLLSLLLGGQYLWFFQRDRVLQNARIRPLLEQTCVWINQYTPCRLPVSRDLDRIRIMERYIHKHQTIPGAMLAHILFQNTASFPQPYPLLELSFYDTHEQQIAVRRFTPAEYLDSPERAERLMPAGQEVHVKLEFRATQAAMSTLGFTIRFYDAS